MLLISFSSTSFFLLISGSGENNSERRNVKDRQMEVVALSIGSNDVLSSTTLVEGSYCMFGETL